MDRKPVIFVSMMKGIWSTVKLVVQKVREGKTLKLSRRQGKETGESLVKGSHYA